MSLFTQAGELVSVYDHPWETSKSDYAPWTMKVDAPLALGDIDASDYMLTEILEKLYRAYKIDKKTYAQIGSELESAFDAIKKAIGILPQP